MVRNLALASVLAMLPATACSQSSDAELDAKADAATKAALEATATPQVGVAVGTNAPDVTLIGTDASPQTLADLTGEAGVVLAFTRSADWCPYCQKQMKELEAAATPLNELGWTLASVSYDSPDVLAAFADKNDLTYPLLSDTDSAAIKAFNLLNEEVDASTRYYGIPHPALVFVRADGTIAAMLREEGYKDRPPADVVISTAESL